MEPSSSPTEETPERCPFSDINGRIYFAQLTLAGCLQIEVGTGGLIRLDSGDITCSNSLFNADKILGEYNSVSTDDVISYTPVAPFAFEGNVDGLLYQSKSKVPDQILKWDPLKSIARLNMSKKVEKI